MIYITSDHGGFELKSKIINYLRDLGYGINDLGPFEFDKDDNYSKYGIKLGEKVASEEDSLGIAICKSGAGMNIAVNKVDGIRGVELVNKDQAIMSKKDDNTNVLVLAANYFENENYEIIKDWIEAEFKNQERYINRLNEIKEYEKAN